MKTLVLACLRKAQMMRDTGQERMKELSLNRGHKPGMSGVRSCQEFATVLNIERRADIQSITWP